MSGPSLSFEPGDVLGNPVTMDTEEVSCRAKKITVGHGGDLDCAISTGELLGGIDARWTSADLKVKGSPY